MGSPPKLFAVTLCYLAFTVVHTYGDLVMLLHPDDPKTHTKSYTCMSDDDGSALAWVHYNTLAHVEDFKPRRPATGNVRDCAIRGESSCLAEWDQKGDWRVVNSAAKPTGPVYDQRWENFQHFEMPSGPSDEWRYKKVGVVNKSSSTLQFSVQEASGADFGVLLCEREEPHQGPCVWIQGSTLSRIKVKFCARGAVTLDGYVDGIALFKLLRPLKLEWNTQQQTIKMLWGNNSEPLVEGPMPPWDQVSAVAASVLGYNFRLKFHFFDYHFTDAKNAVISTNEIEHSGTMFCAELPVGLCSRCKLNAILVDEYGSEIETWPISGDEQDPNNGLLAWRLVKLNTRFDDEIPKVLTLKIKTILDGDEAAGGWVIDNFRVCQSGNQRESRLTVRKTMRKPNDYVYCQKLSPARKSKVYRSNRVISNKTKAVSELQEFLRPKNGRVVGRGGHICSPSGCTCDRGWTGMDCADECDDGFYGFSCSKTCGSCRNFQPCNKSTGFCKGGCHRGHMIEPLCKTAVGAPTIENVRSETASVRQSIEFNEDEVPHKIRIQIREADGEKWVDFTAKLMDSAISSSYEANITRLRVHTNYVARAVAVVGTTGKPALTFGPENDFTTFYEDLPHSLVSNLKISDDKSRIFWDKPLDCNEPKRPTEIARIFIREYDSAKLIHKDQTPYCYYNLSNLHLKPLTYYVAQVYLVRDYDDRENPEAFHELKWKTNFSGVEALTVFNVTDTSARIVQNVGAAAYGRKIFGSFILSELWGDTIALLPTNIKGLDHELDVKNLEPNVLHRVYSLVTVVGSDGATTLDSSPAVFLTDFAYEPDFKLTLGEENLTIHMPSRPEDLKRTANGEYFIEVYDTAKRSLEFRATFTSSSVLIPDLNPDTEYDVRIHDQGPHRTHLVFDKRVRTPALKEAVLQAG